MFKKHLLTLFAFLISISFLNFAQDLNLSRPGTLESIKNNPVNSSVTENVIFSDYFNGDNTLAGLAARGWVVLNEDGGGTTDPFYQGSIAVFPAYEGPDTGYIASNYNGANGFIIDHWLISPEITVNAGDTLSFWHRSPDGNPYDDSIYVRYSTTAGITPAAFDVTWGRYLVSEAGWAKWTGTFNHSGTIRFAIQYYIFDGGPSGLRSNYMGIDYLEVISAAPASDIKLIENFEYGSVNDTSLVSLTPNWVRHSGAMGPAYNATGLTYTGHPSNGVGGAVTFLNGGSGNNDGDIHRVFDPLTETGNLYVFLLVNLSSARNTSDYFFHLGPDPISTTFRARFYARSFGTGWVAGFSKSGSTGTIIEDTLNVLNLDQTYLAAIKYEFNTTAADDDLVTLYIYESGLPLSEPGTPYLTIGPLGAGVGSDPVNLGSIAIRQGTNSPTGTIDGIIVSTVWDGTIPVELTSFTAASNGNNITLNWSTATEVNNSGFEVERKNSSSNWTSIGFVQGNGTTTEAKQYSFIDKNLTAGNYSYRLKQVDFDGTFEYSKAVEVEVVTPDVYELAQNYPNPFNPSTTIKFNIPESGNVKLAVYNLLGQEVKTLVNGFRTAGSYTVNFDAANFTSGVYLYKLETSGFVQTRKMMLIK